MDFVVNKTTVEVIKEGAFGGTYLRGIYPGDNDKRYKKHGMNLMSWEILIKSAIAQVIMMLVLINIVLNVERHLSSGKMKDAWIL